MSFITSALYFTSTALSRAHGVHLPFKIADGTFILFSYVIIICFKVPIMETNILLQWVSGSCLDHTITAICQNFVFKMTTSYLSHLILNATKTPSIKLSQPVNSVL